MSSQHSLDILAGMDMSRFARFPAQHAAAQLWLAYRILAREAWDE